jgi:hypothetical protein
MLRDRFGRVPDEAHALVRQFLTRARLAAIGVKRLAYRDETYLIEYPRSIALESAFAPGAIELRPLRAGRAHLVIPRVERTPRARSEWILALLQGPGQPTKMTARERR